MAYYITKLFVTAVLIVVISEVAKRSSLLGGILASAPLVSVLAMIWLYLDTKEVAKVAALSTSVFWLVIPSLTLFVALPMLLKKGLGFYPSLGTAILIMIGSYYLMIAVLGRFGIRL